MSCVNCGEPIRRTEPSDRVDPRDFEWVHEGGNPICDLTMVASPGGDGYGPAPGECHEAECKACGGRGGFAASGETCSDCLGTGSIPCDKRDVAEHANVCSLPFGHEGGHWWDEGGPCRHCGCNPSDETTLGTHAGAACPLPGCMCSETEWGTYYPDPYNPNEAQP